MVKTLSRRDALKVGAVGLGGSLLAASSFGKKKGNNNMTIGIDAIGESDYSASVTQIVFDVSVRVGLNYPGLIVAVTNFTAGEATSVLWQGLNLTKIDPAFSNGSLRSELWYLANAPAADSVVEVNFSQSTTARAAFAAYQYFGGIGFSDGDTGTGTTASMSFDPAVYPLRDNSILIGNLSVDASSGWASAGTLNARWGLGGGGALGMCIGCDAGPISPPATTTISFSGASANWAMSVAELLDYQDNPPAIMGM